MSLRALFFFAAAAVVALAVWAALPSEPSPPSAAVAAAGRGDPAVEAAVRDCVDTQRRVAERRRMHGPAEPGAPSDSAVIARACAPLYADADCRAALIGFDDSPIEARVATVFQRCSRAYCDKLRDKPRACTSLPDDPSQMAAAWNELRDAILRHDHGADVATRVADALKDFR